MRAGSGSGYARGEVLAEARSWAAQRAAAATTDSRERVADRLALIPLAVVAIIILGLTVRLVAAERLSPHVDEAASLLATHMVAERGVPILPSGTVYLQGATLSYLLAPLVWLGAGDLQDLDVLRFASVLAGTVAVYLTYRLGRAATGDDRVGLLAALFVALDPVSVQWSGHLRMYGLLQALTVALAWAFILALRGTPRRRPLAALVVLFWLAIFTHVGAALLWPPMALVALLIYRRALLSRGRDLVLALALAALAPVALVGINNALGTASVGGSGREGPSVSFVGDNLLFLGRLLRPDVNLSRWPVIFADHNLAWIIPGLLVALSCLVAARRFRPDPARGPALIALLALYWIPVVGVGAFTVSPKERYLLHVHLLGYVLVAALAVELFRSRGRVRSRRRQIGRAVVALGFVPVVLLQLVASLTWRLDHPIVHPDHNAALAYVAEHHAPGEPVVVSLPAVAYLSLGGADDLLFLAGPDDRPRANRYTRPAADGRLIDYWAGAGSIVSTTRLCGFLATQPDAWLVVDEERLDADWAYAGRMAEIVRGATDIAFEAPGEALVLRVAPPASWSARATNLCTGAPAPGMLHHGAW